MSVISYYFEPNLISFLKNEILDSLKIGNKLILLKEFPIDDLSLQNFINQLGNSLKENRNNNGKDVFDVKVKKQNNYFISIANTNFALPLHTDCAVFESVPNCLGLLCVQPAKNNEGVNTFMFLDEFIKGLQNSEIQKLINKKWSFNQLEKSILNYKEGQYKICYDRIMMESFSEINEEEVDFLNKLDATFNKLSFKLKLDKGDWVYDKIHFDIIFYYI